MGQFTFWESYTANSNRLHMTINQIPETEAQKHTRELMDQFWISLEVTVNETPERIAEIFSYDETEYQRYLDSDENRDSFNKPVSFLTKTDEIVRQLKLLWAHLKPKKIHYPCCGNDISPSIAFPESEVIYSDLNKDAIDLLVKHGYKAYREDARKFTPEGVDVVFLLNPTFDSEAFANQIVAGGYIICNDHHWNAKSFFRNSSFRQVGLVYAGTNGDPEQTFQIVEDGVQNIWRSTDDLYIFQKIH